MTTKREIHGIYVGAETGLLKGVKVCDNSWDNLTSVDKITREKEITTLCWADQLQNEVCLGRRDGSIDIYNRTKEEIVESYSDTCGEGILKGLVKCDSSFVTCTDKGHLRVTDGQQDQLSMDVGDNIYCLKQHPTQPHLVATGGKENDLKIWNLQEPNEPVFKAKNVRNDWLNLRVPIWVTDAEFFPDSDKIVTCTGHHQVRVYDPSSSMRRPVLDIEFDEYPLMALSLRHGYSQVMVGNTQGVMALMDLRGKGHLVQKYKGFAGGIRSVACHPHRDVVVSCGLDRYLRIHDINSRELVDKYYMKSRLNKVLLADQWEIPSESPKSRKNQLENVKKRNRDDNDDSAENEEEEVWNKMSVVKTKEIQKLNLAMKRKKKESSDDSDFVDDENDDSQVVSEDEGKTEDLKENQDEELEEEEPKMKRTKRSKSTKKKGNKDRKRPKAKKSRHK